MIDWQPIETYPTDYLTLEECHWGPVALFYAPKTEAYPNGPQVFVGWLEADMWHYRDANVPWSCGDVFGAEPTYWAKLNWPDGTALDSYEFGRRKPAQP